MATFLLPTPEVALAGQDGGERLLTGLSARVPADLVLVPR
jgi:hypothetical protein